MHRVVLPAIAIGNSNLLDIRTSGLLEMHFPIHEGLLSMKNHGSLEVCAIWIACGQRPCNKGRASATFHVLFEQNSQHYPQLIVLLSLLHHPNL
eukprot:3077763-Amphidinium_carterae.1